jgi:hypothetical protein
MSILQKRIVFRNSPARAIGRCVGVVFCQIAISNCLQAASIYMIDINDVDTPVTAPGWTALDAVHTGSGTTVVVDGITFEIFSADGARLRGTTEAPNPNPLTGDFVFDDGAGQAVGLRLGSPTAAAAGTLAAGQWQVEMWIYDATVNAGNQAVGFQTLPPGMTAFETIVSSTVTPHATDPAITFLLDADGVSHYSVFTRENSDLNRSRLNAVRVTMIPEPAALTIVAAAALLLMPLNLRHGRTH